MYELQRAPGARARKTDEVDQLLLPIEDVFHRLRVEAEWLRRTMVIVDAHVGRGGPGTRRYSRSRLSVETERVRGMLSLVACLIDDRVPGASMPPALQAEVWDKIQQAYNVADGHNPDGTQRKKVG